MTADTKVTLTSDADVSIIGRRAKSAMTSAPTKSATFVRLLQRARGATSTELIAATDWQAHSVRAFLSGLRKKGQTVVREARKNGEFAYRLDAAVKVEPIVPAARPTDLTDA